MFESFIEVYVDGIRREILIYRGDSRTEAKRVAKHVAHARHTFNDGVASWGWREDV
jgi:hypothetical protein